MEAITFSDTSGSGVCCALGPHGGRKKKKKKEKYGGYSNSEQIAEGGILLREI